MCLVTFAVYVYSSAENILTPEVAFVSLSLFSIMRLPMSLLPMLIVYCVEVLDYIDYNKNNNTFHRVLTWRCTETIALEF